MSERVMSGQAQKTAEPVYYFGCLGETEHYLHRPGPQEWPRKAMPDDFVRLFGYNGGGLDASMIPKGGPQVDGRAHLHRIDGWTVLAFWDRSVDSRSGSNSVFVTRGTLDFASMLEAARAAWPEVFASFTFDVVEARGDE